MAGNVREWVNDWYKAITIPAILLTAEPSNPPGPASGTHRLLRGGAGTTDRTLSALPIGKALAQPVIAA